MFVDINMKGANLQILLRDTLNPSQTNFAYQRLAQQRSNRGFAVQLLVMSDNIELDISIRQSALIYLKNIIQDHCEHTPILHFEDLNMIKSNLLQALIRNVLNNKLAPTLRQIIFKLAEKYYPQQWPEFVKDALIRLESSQQLPQLLGVIEGLKAVYSVLGSSLTKQIKLNNICNISWLPLLKLASKLFSNFNEESGLLLQSLFKLFTVALKFYVPQTVALNIHSLMIFVKKILDLRGDFGSQNKRISSIKKICLRLLYRMYQKHVNPRSCDNRFEFAMNFQNKYTKPFVQTLLLQLLQNSYQKTNPNFEVVNTSLSILSFINRQNRESSQILLNYRQKIIRICIQRFKINLSQNFNSFINFKMFIDDKRHHLKDLFFSIITCETLPQLQTQTVSSTLGLLLQYIEKGDDSYKQLILYLFSSLSNQTQYLRQSIDSQMTALIIQYVVPLLKDNNHPLVRGRACQLIACYNDLDLPVQCLTDLAGQIYSCMLVQGNSPRQIFLKVYACNAFNSIMRFDPIVQFIKPYLKQILQIYTSLLQAHTSIIQNFKDVIGILEQQIAPFANDLIKLLLNMFNSYSRGDKSTQNMQNYDNNNDEDDQDQQQEQQQQKNTNIIARACVHSIRQILTASSNNQSLSIQIQQQLLSLVVYMLSDPKQMFFEEGLNILNLILHKLQNHPNQNHYIFFRVIVYAILGVPQEAANSIRSRNDMQSNALWNMIQNVSIEPDLDFLQNSVGCLRNYIAKSSSSFLRSQRDETGQSYFDYLYKIPEIIHTNSSKSQSDRLIALTIYVSLIEHKILNQNELSNILNNLTSWMNMQMQAKKSQFFGDKKPKLAYTSVYLQIAYISIYFYGNIIKQQSFYILLIERTLQILDQFQCDYQLQRLLFGINTIMDRQLITDQFVATKMMSALPQIVLRICRIRSQGQVVQEKQMDDEAQEEKAFGYDENTHMIGLNGWKNNPNDKEGQLQEEEQSDDDWEQQFNKFYVSPLDNIDELKYLVEVLAKSGSYVSLMNSNKLQQLGIMLQNAPPKFGQAV